MRTPDINAIIRVQKMAKKKIPYRQISMKVLGRVDSKQIYRWVRVDVKEKIKELSTVR
jgi:hypothetical protein